MKTSVETFPVEIDEKSLKELYQVFGNESLIRLFKKRSIIAQLLMADPGTFKMLEIVYTNQTLEGKVDNYLLESLPAQGLRNRFAAVISYSEKIIREMVEKKKGEPIRVINLGSGSARDVIAILAKNTDISASISVDCIDIDWEALTIAQKLAKEKRVNSSLTLIQSNLTSCSYRKEMDLGILIGILCGLEHRQCVLLLKKIRKYFKKGGVLIASNVTTGMVKQQPFFSRIILEETIGWKLVYKTPDELQKIFEEAGYEWVDVFYDEPTRFHAMGVGVVPLA